MPLSAQCIQSHITANEAKLRASYRDYRHKWPSRLFRHEPLANAVQILQSGHILSRNDSEGVRAVDIAGIDVISLTDTAHQFVRLYFRPKTPTQYHIEGLRKPSEYYHGYATCHAPVLIMFVFKAESILRRPETWFSDGNMQSAYSQRGNTEQFFAQIAFDKVYHEGSIGGDHSIITARCAEVLAPSPLDLRDSIQWIYCRSHAERQTLLYMLGRNASKIWAPLVQVSNDIQVFQRDYLYLEAVSLQADGIAFSFHQRPYPWKIDVDMKVWNSKAELVSSFHGVDWCSMPNPSTANWILKTPLKPGRYKVEVELEGCPAYSNELLLDPKPF